MLFFQTISDGSPRRRAKGTEKREPILAPPRLTRSARGGKEKDCETDWPTNMNSIYDGRTIPMKWLPIGILALTLVFVAGAMPRVHAETPAAATESVIVYPSIVVTVNKSIVLRLPKKASKVSVTQPQIAEAVVVAPDEIVINGKAGGTTSLVVWFDESQSRRK